MLVHRRIQIPEQIDRILDRSEDVGDPVRNTLSLYSQWLATSKLPFFPEYTDHGPTHISAVLASAAHLMSLSTGESPSPVDLLTPMDMGALVLAVLFHDIALHITEDVFIRLVEGQTNLEPISDFGDQPWPKLWAEFTSEATRFSSRQLEGLFGHKRSVVVPDFPVRQWNDDQRLLVGEFIRRHHHRLAHQLAISGFPGTADDAVLTIDPRLKHRKNIIGLIARSHGMELRPCADYLKARYCNNVDPLSVHAVYLMCILRIADYLQIDSERSNQIQLKMQSLRSPISVRAHRDHAAITSTEEDPADPEACRVFVETGGLDSVALYLRVRDLLASIQSELDNSWAMLGEVYGLLTARKLDRLKIRIRRIRSNLDSRESLASLPFVAERIRFQSSDARLFKLLIKPLYGASADAGVRELLQNSIDAVRELSAYAQHHSEQIDSSQVASSGQDVTVSVKELGGRRCLVIEDRGIGMTLNVIKNYFLTVGASYRDSIEWQREFGTSERRSTILRTGYFGIGALAAFLIGDEINVETRHVGDITGYTFTASLDTDPIEVRTVRRAIGTTITIPLRPDLVSRNWMPRVRYYLPWPSVRIAGFEDPDEGTYCPGQTDASSPKWQRLPSETHPIVFWQRTPSAPYVLHNGLKVDDSRHILWSRDGYGVELLMPPLSILDLDGLRGATGYLNLSRTQFLPAEFSHTPHIVEDVLRNYLAFLLVMAPTESLPSKDWSPRDYPWVSCSVAKDARDRPGGHAWVLTRDGLALLDAHVLSDLGVRTLVLAHPTERFRFEKGDDLSLAVLYQDLRVADLKWRRVSSPGPADLCIAGTGEWYDNSQELHTIIGEVVPPAEERRRRLTSFREVGDPAWTGQFRRFYWTLRDPHPCAAAPEMSSGVPLPQGASEYASPLVWAWKKYIKHPVIPYDLKKRRNVLREAYRVLAPDIEAWERLLASKVSHRDDAALRHL